MRILLVGLEKSEEYILTRLLEEIFGCSADTTILYCGFVDPNGASLHQLDILIVGTSSWQSDWVDAKLFRNTSACTILFSSYPLMDRFTAAMAFGVDWILLKRHLSVELLLEALYKATAFQLSRLREAKSALQLKLVAHTDELTKLGNLRAFRECFEEMAKSSISFTLLILDVNDFKKINDKFGYVQGDMVLQEVAERISKIDYAGASCHRIGGDEFAVLLPGTRNIDDTQSVASDFHSQLCGKYCNTYGPIDVTVSIGYAQHPFDGKNINDLKNACCRVLGVSKSEKKRDYVLCVCKCILNTPGTESRTSRLNIYVQSIYSSCSSNLQYMEALARLSQNGRMLDTTSVISSLLNFEDRLTFTKSIITLVCQAITSFSSSGKSLPPIIVNVEADVIASDEFYAFWSQSMEAFQLQPGVLNFEITERVEIRDYVSARKSLQSLRNAGARIALDDFGTMNSNFEWLLKVPCDIVKIDRSIVGQISTDQRALAIFMSIIRLTKELGVEVVAEGIENSEQFRAARKSGADMVQGYFLSRPMPLQNFWY